MTRRDTYIVPSNARQPSMIDVIGTFLFPQTVYPNRTIDPSGNNVIIVRNNNIVYVIDVDGTIIHMYQENGVDNN